MTTEKVKPKRMLNRSILRNLSGELLDDYVRGFDDPVYLIEKYMRVISPNFGGRIPFSLFEFQSDLISTYKQVNCGESVAVKASRQMGTSTTTIAFLTVEALYSSDVTIVLHSNNTKCEQYNLERFIELLLCIPKEFYGGIANRSKERVVLGNGAYISIQYPYQHKNIQDDSIYIYIDNAAFPKTTENRYGFMGMPSSAIKIYTSSTYKGDLFFKDVYIKADYQKSLYWFYNPIFNEGMFWYDSDGNMLCKEKNFTIKSINDKIINGFKPNSPWREGFIKILNHNADSIKHEIDCEF